MALTIFDKDIIGKKAKDTLLTKMCRFIPSTSYDRGTCGLHLLLVELPAPSFLAPGKFTCWKLASLVTLHVL
jgi:hypothetical protein